MSKLRNSTQVLEYLTANSPQLRSLELRCAKAVLDPCCLKFLHIEPKKKLECLILDFVVETSGLKFVSEIKKIIEASPSLQSLGRLFSWNNVAESELENLKKWIRSKNYDINIIT